MCECGCARPAPISPVQITRNGVLKYRAGEPQRFIQGHGRRLKSIKKYRIASTDDTGQSKRHIAQHTYLAEKALGHRLPPRAVVHHVDGDRDAKNPRLVICEDDGYHNLLHKRLRIQRAGGNPWTDKICTGCKQVKAQTEFNHNRARVDGRCDYCRPCDAIMKSNSYQARKAARHLAR